MTDIVSKGTRSRMMAGIKNKNTKPEMLVRRLLFSNGFCYRLHDKRLPGKPDIYLPKYNCVIFIQGCFWHGHQCKYFKWPQTNKSFWHTKISTTKSHDLIVQEQLIKLNYHVIVIWECEIKNNWPIIIQNLPMLIKDRNCASLVCLP